MKPATAAKRPPEPILPVGSGRSRLASVSPFLLVLAASAAAWELLFFVFPPARQDFPLVDDWAFARGAFLFASGKGIHYTNWASMPQLGQWLWACPFVWLLGESHFALRVSTILLSWLGLWAFYDLLRQEGVSRGKSSFATAVLAANPVFFLLQGTFMTDIPSLSLALLALAFYVRALRGGGNGWLVGACAVAVLAAVTRQTTMTVPVVAALLLWRESSLRRQWQWWLALTLPMACGLLAHFWFQGRADIITIDIRPLNPFDALLCPYLVLHFCGLSALPLLLLAPRVGSWRAFTAATLLMLTCAGYWLALLRSRAADEAFLFPYTGTMLTPFGAYASGLVPGEAPLVLGLNLRVFLTLLGCLAGAALFLRILAWRRQERRAGPLLLFSLWQIPFILTAPLLWDRYFLGLMPGAFFLMCAELPANPETRSEPTGYPAGLRWWAAGLATLVAFAAGSVCLMHDWLAWNSARWQLGTRAVNRRLDPLDIEGGMEWNGWCTAAYQTPVRRSWKEKFSRIRAKAGEPRKLTYPETRLWFPEITGRYALSYSPLPNSVVIDSEPYTRWLLSGDMRFFLVEWAPDKLKQKSPNEKAPATSR